jgi:thiol:disulfide interchange protein
VNWSCPIEFAEGVKPEDLSIDVEYYGQRCADEQGCIRIAGVQATANFAGVIETIDSDAPLRIDGSHLLISGKLTHQGTKLKPGDKAVVEVTLEPVDNFHVYEYSVAPQTDGVEKKTLLAVTKSYEGWAIGPVETVPKNESQVKEKDGVKNYSGPVTFKIPVTVAKSAEAKEHTLRGVVGFMTCDAEGCTRPQGVKWEVAVPVGVDAASSTNLRVTETGVSYTDIEEDVTEANKKNGANGKNAGAWSGYSPAVVLPLAFVAGFILNFMPCVLPVVGLKIMSFMHMAGENPRRVFMLNFVFVLGMLAVFMTFALLAVMFNFGWGEAYTNLTFKVVMIAIVFGFGLSFFGVWEIPMPGIVDSDAANDLANKEGFVGQFFKGILTTLLATPCSGPMLIPAVVWAMAQPPWMTFTVFLALGLGMALPYLVIGAFPKLASFLPKPGPWMETFKQIMGFVLIATTIFLINGVGWKYNASVLTLLLFIGVGCWWIGRTELHEPLGKQFKAWVGGLAMIAVGGFIAFGVLLPWYELEYKPYSDAAVAKHLAKGQTVVVDFTADW